MLHINYFIQSSYEFYDVNNSITSSPIKETYTHRVIMTGKII